VLKDHLENLEQEIIVAAINKFVLEKAAKSIIDFANIKVQFILKELLKDVDGLINQKQKDNPNVALIIEIV